MIRLLFFLLLAYSCSGNKLQLSQQEKKYLQVQDSLQKYRVEVLSFDKDTMDRTVEDYMQLSYQDFKTKHRLHDDELDLLTKLFTSRYEMGRLLQEINSNRIRIKKMNNSLQTMDQDYSF